MYRLEDSNIQFPLSKLNRTDDIKLNHDVVRTAKVYNSPLFSKMYLNAGFIP